MRRTKGWIRMVAWVLVGILLVSLWVTPGEARQPKAEKPKPTDAQMTGLLVALEDEWPQVKRLVFAELVALLESPLRIPHVQAISFLKNLKASPAVEVLHVDAELDSAAWQLLAARPDKAWSLVDCSSFAIMQQQHLSQALTNDHHFEQAGFIRLLK